MHRVNTNLTVLGSAETCKTLADVALELHVYVFISRLEVLKEA